MADLEQRVPIVPASIFQIGSVSKQFTAMAMLLLEQEGRISLDDDIRRYIPEVPDLDYTITIRQMIHHTSGMRDLLGPLVWTGTRYPADPITVRETLELVNRQTGMNGEPGVEYSYNNTAAGHARHGVHGERRPCHRRSSVGCAILRDRTRARGGRACFLVGEPGDLCKAAEGSKRG